jgi:tRNA-Thr(GGU) m(6)t(6)A37 methyltransferase TsaA
MGDEQIVLRAIGTVRSALRDPAAAPKQGDEGAPDAWLEISPDLWDAVAGIAPGDALLVLTWLHLGDRGTLRVHPRDDRSRPQQGVFATRSPDRPNPLGVHRVEVIAVDAPRLRVRGLEAIDGTPLVDIKPVLSGDAAER